MIWVTGAISFIGGIFAGTFALAIYAGRKQDARRAAHVQLLKLVTPAHTSNGGPTTYDEHGRVEF